MAGGIRVGPAVQDLRRAEGWAPSVQGSIIAIPYQLIANIIAGFFIVTGFLAAEERGRIAIVILAAATLIVPQVAGSNTVGIVCFGARVLLGIGCAIFAKWRNAVP